MNASLNQSDANMGLSVSVILFQFIVDIAVSGLEYDSRQCFSFNFLLMTLRGFFLLMKTYPNSVIVFFSLILIGS